MTAVYRLKSTSIWKILFIGAAVLFMLGTVIFA